MSNLWYGIIKRNWNSRMVFPRQLSFFSTSAWSVPVWWVWAALTRASMELTPGLVPRSPLSWLHGGETETPAPCCLWASHLYCHFTSRSFKAPGCFLPIPGPLTLRSHSHTWRLGVKTARWNAGKPQLSPVLCVPLPTWPFTWKACQLLHTTCPLHGSSPPPVSCPWTAASASSCSGWHMGSCVKLFILSCPIF